MVLLFLSGCQTPEGIHLTRSSGKVLLEVEPQPAQRPKRIPLPKGEPFEFSLEGETIQIPCRIEELLAKGWTLDPSWDYEWLPPGVCYENVVLYKGNAVLHCIAGNLTASDPIVLKSGWIAGVRVTQNPNFAPVFFRLDETLRQGMKRSELHVKRGRPMKVRPTTYGEELEYHRGDERIFLYSRNDRIEGFSVRHAVQTKDMGIEPLFLHLEEPHWGEDISTGRLLLEGEFYRLPAELRQFQNNGWEINQRIYPMIPQTQGPLRLKRGSQRITLKVFNHAATMMDLSEALVIGVRNQTPNDPLSMQLSHTLCNGMTQKKLFGYIQPYKPRKRDTADLLWYEVIRNGFTLRFAITKNNARLSSIELIKLHSPLQDPPKNGKPYPRSTHLKSPH